MNSIRDLVVPYRRHSLRECDSIIQTSEGIVRVDMRFIAAQKRVGILLGGRTDSRSAIHAEWIEVCLNEARKPLTPYEQSFLYSISDWLAVNGRLTSAQAKKLEEIYTEKT